MNVSTATATQVDSKLLASVAYNVGESILELEFRDGAIYLYFAVPEAIHHGLLAADSKGSYFNSQIRTCFRYSRIKPPN
jgi:hypothetical protein